MISSLNFFLADRASHAGEAARADILMDRRAEGWVGLPHGGIAMATIVELGACLDSPGDIIRHPFTVDYRLGGSRLRVGDRVCIEAEQAQGGITGKIVPEGCDAPYLSAALSWEGREKQDEFKGVLPARFSDIEGSARTPALLQELLRLRRGAKRAGPETEIPAAGRARMKN